jgi:hypothetical protein
VFTVRGGLDNTYRRALCKKGHSGERRAMANVGEAQIAVNPVVLETGT